MKLKSKICFQDLNFSFCIKTIKFAIERFLEKLKWKMLKTSIQTDTLAEIDVDVKINYVKINLKKLNYTQKKFCSG